jgi:hypothetical protein
MGTGLGVTTETRDLGKIQAELVLEPVDGVSGLVGEDANQVVAGQITGRFLGVVEEDLWAI